MLEGFQFRQSVLQGLFSLAELPCPLQHRHRVLDNVGGHCWVPHREGRGHAVRAVRHADQVFISGQQDVL